MKSLVLVTLATLGTTACMMVPPAPTETPPIVEMPQTCQADQYQQFVGQRSPQITLPARTVARDYRTGDPLTMDFIQTRLNFEYDRTGKLVKVSCG